MSEAEDVPLAPRSRKPKVQWTDQDTSAAREQKRVKVDDRRSDTAQKAERVTRSAQEPRCPQVHKYNHKYVPLWFGQFGGNELSAEERAAYELRSLNSKREYVMAIVMTAWSLNKLR
jgi:hypothetical protein